MELFVAGAIVAVAVIWVGHWLRANRSPAPAPPPVPAGGEPLESPALRRIGELRDLAFAVDVWRADDLLAVAPFRELIAAFAEPSWSLEALLEFVDSEDGLLACAAACALARRPRDEETERRVFARLNSHGVWTRHFLLKALEAWNAGDATLVGRVLTRLDESWRHDKLGAVLERFMRRRALVAPLTLEGVERREPARMVRLHQVLASVDPELRKALFASPDPSENLEDQGALEGRDGEGATDDGEGFAEPPGLPAARQPLSAIGRLWEAGKFEDGRLVGSPSSDALLERGLAALTGPRRRSALVIGDAGVGKTSLVRRLAARLSAQGWTLFEASASQVNAGMGFVGQLEERLRVMRAALARPRMLWIIPDFHQLLWTGRHLQNPVGMLEMMMPAIEAGELLVLGESRPGALERVLLDRPEIGRLFEMLRIEPPPRAEVDRIVAGWAADAVTRRRVEVPPLVQREAIALARQYLSGQSMPGGPLRLLELAVEEAVPRANEGAAATLALDDLVAALARSSGLPIEILDERRTLDLDAVRKRFEARVIGQPEAVTLLVERLALLKAGITDPARPTGVFLFAGASGTGKTELAKTLAEYLFGSADRLIRVDMSELQDHGSIERLVGSTNPLDQSGNSLAERVRRQPFCVVLLDEFEKAHPRVWDLFLQVFDDGRLTSARGDTADFRQAIIILTSNLGSSATGEARLGLVGGADAFSPAAIERAVERAFRPELRNRLDRTIVFRPLTRDVMRLILRKELVRAFERRGLRRRQWAVELEDSAIELLIERGFSTTLGARPLLRALEQLLLTPLAAAIVERRAPERDQFLFVRADGDGLAVEFVDPDAPSTGAAPTAGATLAGGELASIAFEARGTRAEVETLGARLAQLQRRLADPAWSVAKQALLLETSTPGFWERADRFERLGRAEYLDRVESGARGAASLLERLQGKPTTPRPSYPRDLVSRLARQILLLDAAAGEALEVGPRDAFVAVEPQLDDHATDGHARDFARRIAAMYAAWARARGMRFTAIEQPAGDGGDARHVLAVAGFAAYALLAPEDGLHVREWDEPGERTTQRATVRVRVAAQPPLPARDGVAGLRRQAREALAATDTGAPWVARRYREGQAPLVRDAVRGWRTGRIDRVLAGDFDVIPARD